jgi:hypothetical protein
MKISKNVLFLVNCQNLLWTLLNKTFAQLILQAQIIECYTDLLSFIYEQVYELNFKILQNWN